MLSPDLIRRLDLAAAVRTELTSGNRLLPRRWDFLKLAEDPSEAERSLRPLIRKLSNYGPADVVFADKGWRGARPLSIMPLEHRVVYRAIVDVLKTELPEHLRQRPPVDEFREAPLSVAGTTHISKTDITSYYVYVDHAALGDELIAQTGDEGAVSTLQELLSTVMGRSIGLPQVHTASDTLGDTYIDPARRRMRRRGHAVFTYSDDFRIASESLGSARSAIEACASEVRELGLVLNERKTFTYGTEKYRESLSAFADAERNLFEGTSLSAADFFLLRDDYGGSDDTAVNVEPSMPQTIGPNPIAGSIDDNEVTEDGETAPTPGSDEEHRAAAATKAWMIWLTEDESEESQSGLDAAITQSLLDRALPALGSAGHEGPLGNLPSLLQFEPGLTPQIATYLINYCKHGNRARADVRSAVNEMLQLDILNSWQSMWISHALGYARRVRNPRSPRYLDWLTEQVDRGPDCVAATAAVTLGRLNYGDASALAAALDRVGPEWRHLVLWGLDKLDPGLAAESADSQLDRVFLS